ncbi:hypothetical protein N7517_007699 [Penicillium concentricum]|uniref:Copper acquisition factor BIM1-like domain-containing protein n=1 Tax=Penicillium concentricum TaxID=293559 RepID=A0A9W9SBQ6_9EURO|nr:uncharacterized protein N7517_007699 [Penicillium concentricum]KAJ5375693.1 hypothetical protein N7517_007699 [Penicillium concentricum]
MKTYIALLALSAIGACAHGEEASTEMGPAAFLWPPDRLWGAAYDNNAPCGSSTGAVNRTNFPLINGKLALVIQDESWNVQVAISHKSNPTTNADFEAFVDGSSLADVDPGHECYSVPNPSVDVEEGMNATFQIKYTSDFDTDKNETYYACADVTYIAASKFTYQVPCFNVTTDEFAEVTTTAAAGSTATAKSDTAKNTSTTSEKDSGLSGGAIAGIVIGSVAGLAIGLALLFFYRRLLQKYRFFRQKASARNVDWNEEAAHHKVEDETPIGLRKIR